jgi:hypothetical protein
MQSITVLARRWFNRGPGNTYHSSTILVDGVPVEGVEFAYGYGDHYLTTAFDKLNALGLLPGWTDARTHPQLYCEDKGIKLYYEAVDVGRRKDL